MKASHTGKLSRVLLIEDDSPARKLMCRLLGRAGYRVLQTDHLIKPADLMQLRPDLVILGLVLSGECVGWDYVRELKSEACTAQVPILVACYADSFADLTTVADLSSVTGMLMKPLEPKHFLTTVEAAVRGATMPSSRVQEQGRLRRVEGVTGDLPWGRLLPR